MVFKVKIMAIFFGVFTVLCHAGNVERAHYTAEQYLKNYALSACLADGYKSPEIVNDATASANGYKELGSIDIDAYNSVLSVVRTTLKKEYLSQSGEKLTTMKCIDLYNSKELDTFVKKYSSSK